MWYDYRKKILLASTAFQSCTLLWAIINKARGLMAVGKLFGLPETFWLDIRQFSIYNNNLRLTISSQNGSTLGGSWAIIVGDSVLKQTLPCVFVFLENFILMRLKSSTWQIISTRQKMFHFFIGLPKSENRPNMTQTILVQNDF